MRIGETCLEHHTDENNSDFYKTITVNIVILSERLSSSWSITRKYGEVELSAPVRAGL